MCAVAGLSPARSPRPGAVLLVVSVVAFLAASALTLVALTRDTPEPCCLGPVAAPDERPSPTSAPPASRAPALAQCVVGSWRTVDETVMVTFYNDVGKLPMTTSGRYYEFHADGTGVERNQNTQFVGHHQGTPIRLVANGWREFTWTASTDTITYKAITRTDLTWKHYDNRGLLNSSPELPNPRYNEVNDYTCEAGRLVESNAGGFRSVWTRTTDHGFYG